MKKVILNARTKINKVFVKAGVEIEVTEEQAKQLEKNGLIADGKKNIEKYEASKLAKIESKFLKEIEELESSLEEKEAALVAVNETVSLLENIVVEAIALSKDKVPDSWTSYKGEETSTEVVAPKDDLLGK